MQHARKWISGLIIAAVLGFAFWMWWPPSPASPPVSSPPRDVPPPWPASISKPASGFPKKGVRSGEFDVCGVGKVSLDLDDLSATSKFFDGLTKKARLRWLSALRNSDDYRARATGLYLEGILDRDEPVKDPEAARDELVQLALATKDPAIFALANSKCIKSADDSAPAGACPQLTPDLWTRADPDNAVPWLQLAAKARKENDGAAEAAAFARAAQAHQYESYNWSMFAFAQASMPGDATAADRWYLTTQVLGVEAAMPLPFGPLFRYCSRDAMADAATRRQCNAVAELLVNKATTLLELSLGKSLGTRLGWPPEVVDRLTQQVQASMQAMQQMVPSNPDDQWSCDSVARGNAFMSDSVRLGERGLAEEAIERSGETVAELSRKYSERMEKVLTEARASAQSQSGAAQPSAPR